MMKKNSLSLLMSLITILISASVWSGCSSKSVNESDPKSMYEDAEQDINNDRYLLALDKLRVVKSKFSYSSFGALAQLRIGDVYFLQDSFPEAASAYETFVELYPKHEKASYATFRAGESYFNDIPSTIARDLRTAESAIQAFSTYLKKYPDGEFLQKAKEMKVKAYNKLAAKEFEVAQFYIRRKKPASAKLRLQKILDQYSDSDIAAKAKDLMEHLPAAE